MSNCQKFDLKGTKYKDTKKVTLMLENQLIGPLRELAQADHKTFSGTINEILQQALHAANQ